MNIEKFNPKKDPKYNSFIYRFLKKNKWREINKNSRCCEYCGQWIRRKVKTEKVIRRRDIWEIES